MWAYRLNIPSHWRLLSERYRLIGGYCEDCGYKMFPKQKICPKCRSERIKTIQLPKKGKVLTYTIVQTPPRGFEYYTPYVLAIIELEDGTKIFSQLTDIEPSEVHEGLEVEMTIRKIRVSGESGAIAYAYKFRPCST
jgi:hypothetical protein